MGLSPQKPELTTNLCEYLKTKRRREGVRRMEEKHHNLYTAAILCPYRFLVTSSHGLCVFSKLVLSNTYICCRVRSSGDELILTGVLLSSPPNRQCVKTLLDVITSCIAFCVFGSLVFSTSYFGDVGWFLSPPLPLSTYHRSLWSAAKKQTNMCSQKTARDTPQRNRF